MMEFVPEMGVRPSARGSVVENGRRNRMRARVITAMDDDDDSSLGIFLESTDGVRAEIL